MKLYHTTKVSFLDNIKKQGLIPKNGENSQANLDDKSKVCYSEEMEGVIALTNEFQSKFNELKRNGKINANSLDEFLGESVYLVFDSQDIQNEHNYIDGKTSKTIEPNLLRVCTIKNRKTGEVSYKRDDIVKYMMSKIPFSKYNIPSKSGLNKEAKKNILNQLHSYYISREEELESFNGSDYLLTEISLEEFCKEYINKDIKESKDSQEKKSSFREELQSKVKKEDEIEYLSTLKDDVLDKNKEYDLNKLV